MHSRRRSPVAAGPEQVFSDLREVAARVKDGLSWEIPESLEELPAEELPAGQIAQFARQERTRVLSAGVSGLEKLAEGRADEIDDDESFGMEAIVLLEGRPAILVQNHDFAPQQGDWAVLDGHRAAIRASLSRVGRVELSGHLSLDWLGTAFLVGPDVVMTNRHVAAEFARGDSTGWTFQQGIGARLDMGEEYGGEAVGGPAYDVVEVLGIHEDVDLALLRVAPPAGGGALPAPLAVAADAPADLPGRPVYCVGYPAYDGRRNEPESMRRIFMDIYNVKRLQPGTATELVPDQNVIKHDCSTLGGNSGSPVIDLTDHRVLGLHFGGRYGFGNFAVPLWQLVDDPLLGRAEINFV
ncbi:serine protease [Streptomyces sp. Je 1-4]|uniref:trypsin-like serine peptidase n=1 Tax=Streptomyces TaxID=1883 RepID=UPI0021DAC7D7|nr:MULTISPECIES: serine protease [unclassified Streptomyces]UYB44158.1 serine protease [Streptomyces sp. Je 1-4]UZQ40600.1 serine protease [Streptomyces sp. Je 1-4] [Streptomyces sp. Je 1-4 4N24]UZQ48017.1 serine protease [Streptomyces sp. Je 1-4] [Streptomyces sp. Je 1-4 4N24_ara]